MVKKVVKKVAKAVKKVAKVAKKVVKSVKKTLLAKTPKKTAKVVKVTKKAAKVVDKIVRKTVSKTVKKTVAPKSVKVSKPAVKKKVVSQPVRKTTKKVRHVPVVSVKVPVPSVKKLPPVSPPTIGRIESKRPVQSSVNQPIKKKVVPPPTKGLAPQEIETFQTKLLALRSQLRGQVSTMTDVALDHSFGDLSAMPLHMADIGSDNYEQEQTLAFIESDSNTLIQIEEALQRIKEGTFGVCENCGCFIPKPRLNFLPFAAVCVKCVDCGES